MPNVFWRSSFLVQQPNSPSATSVCVARYPVSILLFLLSVSWVELLVPADRGGGGGGAKKNDGKKLRAVSNIFSVRVYGPNWMRNECRRLSSITSYADNCSAPESRLLLNAAPLQNIVIRCSAPDLYSSLFSAVLSLIRSRLVSHPALFGIYILAYFPHFSLLVRSRLLSHAAPFRIFILIYFPHFSLLLRSRLLLRAAPFQMIILVHFPHFSLLRSVQDYSIASFVLRSRI